MPGTGGESRRLAVIRDLRQIATEVLARRAGVTSLLVIASAVGSTAATVKQVLTEPETADWELLRAVLGELETHPRELARAHLAWRVVRDPLRERPVTAARRVAELRRPPELAEVVTEQQYMEAVRRLQQRSNISVRDIEREMKNRYPDLAVGKTTIAEMLRKDTFPRTASTCWCRC